MFDQATLIIGGESRRTGSAGLLKVTDPATDEVIAELPRAGAAEAVEATRLAQKGFAEWSAKSTFERYQILRRAAQLMRERAETAADVMTREQGKARAQALAEWNSCADLLDWSGEEGRRTYGRIVPGRAADISLSVHHRPVGPVAIMAPWNFPAWGPMQKIAPALAAGCSVVVKPSEDTPVTAWAIGRCLLDAGVPARAVSVIWGQASEISDALVKAPEIRKISLTGSIRVGRIVAAAAGAELKKVTMELGGHAPVIVAADADLDALVPMAVTWKFRNAGQVCVSPTRFLVDDAVHDEFVGRFAEQTSKLVVGNGADPATQMGPMTTLGQLQSVDALVHEAVTAGAKLETGGARIGNIGNFYQPTVLSDMTPAMRAMNDEPFGPVALVMRTHSLDEALAEANRLPVGLGSYAFTRSDATAARIAGTMRAGMLGLNHFALALPETPFGGVLDSGFGSEGGTEAIQSYLTTMLVTHKH
ncbi:NAD-dependent succinate-semialdehyde dehydrogenase [Paracoccus kondratievae]|uniref:NAD-dependent succinate-semialdehyde dehydrogenase n=1 Tax=Paracoccus kondratievae TaxID=135740 RepID=A0AAD3NXB7_9RHOB|nr:NAD-dependent succinate-semialdehyde dehydrogenase [Paracoccus kondratievae]GLK64331.1 NAD-dependent succinate-semialdehyde dehydrogenase [Paracoccus kondratievae]